MSRRGRFGKRFVFVWPVLAAIVAGACGGSARVVGSAGDGASGSGGDRCASYGCINIACPDGQITVPPSADNCCSTCAPGGGPGAAGAPSAGGALSVGGALSAGAPSGGAPAGGAPAGGAPGGAGGPAGSGGNCAGLTCNLNCANGEVLEQVPGVCCPVCSTQSQACLDGQQSYRALVAGIVQLPSSESCNTDSDCTRLDAIPQCGDICPHVLVNVATASVADDALKQWAAMNCSSCVPQQVFCPASLHAVCVSGVCMAYHPV